jgi:DNA-binding transcriptional regulator YiaG
MNRRGRPRRRVSEAEALARSAELISHARLLKLVRTGENRSIRERAGVTQQAVADAVGSTNFSVSRWEGAGRPQGRMPRKKEYVMRYLDVLQQLAMVAGPGDD